METFDLEEAAQRNYLAYVAAGGQPYLDDVENDGLEQVSLPL